MGRVAATAPFVDSEPIRQLVALGEFGLIARYFKRPVCRAEIGVGDDCALLAVPPGEQLAVSTDMLVEGRHFLPTVSPQRLGHKALAVNLSDLAACGATPMAFTLALALPHVDEVFLAGFSQGLLALADTHGCELIGGDTTRGPLTISITVMGRIPSGLALLRSGARAGDDLYVSGTLGDARLALEVFRGQCSLPGEAFDTLRLAMECPTPRVALGQALRGIATSAIDLSDGLLGDLGHVLAASDVGAELAVDTIPRSTVLAGQPLALQRQCTLAGGDDYELLFTAPTARSAAVEQAAMQAGVAVARIGRITTVQGVLLRDAGGHAVENIWAGFDHFAA